MNQEIVSSAITPARPLAAPDPPPPSSGSNPKNVTILLDALKALYNVYETYWNGIGMYDAGKELICDGVKLNNIISLISIEDSHLMEAACVGIEPYEQYIKNLIGE